MNFYKRHIGDYLKDTAHLSLLEHGVYGRLLDVYYTREAGIPDEQAARLIGARSKDECAALKIVLKEFFELVDGVWVQTRCELEIELASAQAEANRNNGKKGGRPKAKANPDKTDEKPNGLFVGSVSETENNLSQTPDSRLQTKTLGEVIVGGTPSRELSDDFTPKDAGEWLRHFRAKHGFEADPTNVNDRKRLWPVFAGWVNAGLTTAFVDTAVASASALSREPIVCLPLYVDRFMANQQAARASPQVNARDESRRRAAEVLTTVTMSPSYEPPSGNVIDVNAKLLG